MHVIQISPLLDLEQTGRDFELFERNHRRMFAGFAEPTLDTYEENGSFVAEVRLPSFRKNEVRVSVVDNDLKISADHKMKKTETGKRHYYTKESRNSYKRHIWLPEEANPSKAEANFKDGVLKVKMPLLRQNRVKSVQFGGRR